MYPISRLFTLGIRAKFAKPLTLQQRSETTFICRPWDIDMFMEMNNGRILTLFDLGRMDLIIRSGMHKTMAHNHWGMVIAGSSIRYRKRIRAFDKVTIQTEIAAADNKWIYLVQSMLVKEKTACSVLIRAAITQQGKVLPFEQINDQLALNKGQLTPAPWIKAWIAAEQARPWPPQGELERND